ncbi:MAG: HAD family hydrolase [Candidatus Diapherotrites archaeon]|nr:HAD family hydrolase [Candidatus Diapherotrites archaeon]
MPMQKLEAVIFDFNGVIADDLEISLDNFVELAKRHGSMASRQDFVDILPTPTIRKMHLIVETGSDIKDAAQLLKENSEIYAESIREKSVLFPKAEETLIGLAKKFPLALVSNVFKAKFDAAISAKAKECFSFIITSDQMEKPKPEPDALLLAAKKLGVKHENCVYVGDSEPDMIAANKAGMVAIGVAKNDSIRKTLEENGAHLIISNIAELPACLAVIEKSI